METVNENDTMEQENSGPVSESAAQKAKERMERWKALQGRAVCSGYSPVWGHPLLTWWRDRKNQPK